MKLLIILLISLLSSCNKEDITPIEIDTTIVDSGMNPNKDLPIIIK